METAANLVTEAELAVPGTEESELAVGGEDDVLDVVEVAGEVAVGETVDLLFFGQWNLSRDAVTIMSELSIKVAIMVTQSV
ncbi:hypothetical protein LOK49_LG08G02323 [Camellia lanceoleosa]|uniref:Uncharacterized protein n=1 Tax=Camellia lanceoleosa TaxID=1840588 RepID=A0ACC0GV68_9ERIC|nr:hypothetical protein LOK49_LG08G02323 [Camellia lanceoleosa]